MCISNKEKESIITQAYLKSIFEYREDGNLIWKVARKGKRIGQIAGCRAKNGYLLIGIIGKIYYAHRLIWLYHSGKWPENVIDHINRDKSDNRIQNLREVSQQENARHQKIRSNNTSGMCGVSWIKATSKWHAKIAVNNENINLGYFTNIEDAISARKAAELKYNFSPYHGNVEPLPNVVNL